MDFVKEEEKILTYWQKNQIFEKSLKKEGGNFVFYEGPPTANAKPGVHHVLVRVYKDIICRYQTMKGKKVLRKAGWDVHGLPVELSVEKELGLKNKKEIEKYGVDKFNQQCRESVWRYTQEWINLTERIAFWLDLKNPYITSDPLYMESVFNIIKQIANKKLLYQDYKVIPYCPRCGTGLSSHEVAQGYRKIKEPAIYIKFEIKDKKFEAKTSLLVWTTTPWTLPGNVAIAINPNIKYILIKVGLEHLILAETRKGILKTDFEILKEFEGKELIGLNYQPLFDNKTITLSPKEQNIYQILAADFVTIDEGTGLVHIAPAFGQEDMELIKTQDKKFPILLTVNEEGKFKPEVKKWAGIFVKSADPLIIKHLQEIGSLFAQEEYQHDYPFCWRCETPLLYYAKKGWFIKITAVKQELIENNNKINWLPNHIKEGRFGEWLNTLKDWALSRERYWGTPLPIWKCEKCEHQEIIGSRSDLKKQKFTTNQYFILRHGEARSNIEEFNSSWPEKEKVNLTEKGKDQIKKIVEKIKKEKINIIFSSDILRAKQTAEIIGKELKLKVNYDQRLREIDVGKFNGKSTEESRKYFNPEDQTSKEEVIEKKFIEGFPGGENYAQVLLRMQDFMKDINTKYQNKNILIVTHGDPIILLLSSFLGWTKKEFSENKEREYFDVGQLKKVDYKIFPYNQKGELDFHRPYIDEVQFLCPKCETLTQRVPELIDCWFDSGSMPFAQFHWTFDNQLSVTNNHLNTPPLFPANYISEAIDQTRGWFYTLLAISTLLGFASPYQNVIVLSHILDQKGQKMAKSKGNVVDPWVIIQRYGADALRWYYFTVNQPGDSKLFDEKKVDQQLKKFMMTFWNCYTFFETYVQKAKGKINLEDKMQNPKCLLDQWILSRLNQLIQETTDKLDQYDIVNAARLIDHFVIDDLSLWYIRRSRTRFQKPNSEQQLTEVASVLGYTLLVLVKLTAPFVPFMSEKVYLNLTNQKLKESVHLENWPQVNKKLINQKLESKMNMVRGLNKQALAQRKEAKIKVRQPLAQLKIQEISFKEENELLELLKEELNVKKIVFDSTIDEKILIDLNITPALKEEGVIREIIRAIQKLRKEKELTSGKLVTIEIKAENQEMRNSIQNWKDHIQKSTLTEELIFNHQLNKQAKEIQLGEEKIWLDIKCNY